MPDQTAAAADVQSQFHPRVVARRLMEGEAGSLRVLITLAIIWIIFAIAHDRFLTPINLTNLALQSVAVGTISVGVVLVLLLGEPKLVILDEPTAALGVAQTQQVLDLVLRLKERGLGVLLVSHNLADVFQVADRVVVLRLGRNAGEFEADAANHSAVVGAITGAAGVAA